MKLAGASFILFTKSLVYAFSHCVGDREFVVLVRTVQPLGRKVVVTKHIAGYG